MRLAVTDALDSYLAAALEEHTVDDGTAVYARTDGVDIELPELGDLVMDAVATLRRAIRFIEEDELHERAMRDVDSRLREAVE